MSEMTEHRHPLHPNKPPTRRQLALGRLHARSARMTGSRGAMPYAIRLLQRALEGWLSSGAALIGVAPASTNHNKDMHQLVDDSTASRDHNKQPKGGRHNGNLGFLASCHRGDQHHLPARCCPGRHVNGTDRRPIVERFMH